MNYKFATKAIHAGQEPEPITGAVMTPIFQTSTYKQLDIGVSQDFNYSRGQNPTRKALENCLAALENGKYSLAFSSGMAAVDCVLHLFQPGDEIIAVDDIYGGSFRLFTAVYAKYGIKFKFVDGRDLNVLAAAITDQTKLIWMESPTNPLLNIIDLKSVSTLCKRKKIMFLVDNTFASPYLQNPLDLGADIVLHSATKYINGHSDVLLGALIINDEEIYKSLYFYYNSCGATPGPQDCFLVLRGIKTLPLRMRAHSENAALVASSLKNHPAIEKVYWPGFTDHPGHEIAKKQMKHFGGVVSILLKNATKEQTLYFASQLKLFILAESLGGVESLVNHSATMSHGSMPSELKKELGITDNLLRLSVGIEDPEDLIADIQSVLNTFVKESL